MAKANWNKKQSDQAKVEQIVTEFFAKSLHIILNARTPYMSSPNCSSELAMSSPSSSTSSSSSVRPRDKWFNLALRECPAALENLDLWRRNNVEQLVVDVVLVQRSLERDPLSFSPKRSLARNLLSNEKSSNCWNSDQKQFGCAAGREEIIERWVVKYETRRSNEASTRSRSSSNNPLHGLYKKSILLLRCLYATVRLLPAYKIFHDLNSTCQIRSFTLAHRVSSFVEPFTSREEAEMQQFAFTPVDTSCGRLCLSVLYKSSLSDMSSEPSTLMSPQFIPDYARSLLVDPIKRITSLPMTGSHGSTSSLPFSRRHSWSFDHSRASTPLVSLPSPTHTELQSSISSPSSRRFAPNSFLPQPPSPSLSISPPNWIPRSHPTNTNLGPSSALTKRTLPSSSLLKSTQSDNAQIDKSMGPIQTRGAVDKLFSLGKDDARKYSGVRKTSSNSSSRVSFSRSSSRSVQDDFGDTEMDCPFDYDDMTDSSRRHGSFYHKGYICEPLDHGRLLAIRRSPDAAVGALVHMLKTALPLCEDVSNSTKSSRASSPRTFSNTIQEHDQMGSTSQDTASSCTVTSKTTSIALEELRGYKEMKDLLLSKSNTLANRLSAAEPFDR